MYIVDSLILTSQSTVLMLTDVFLHSAQHSLLVLGEHKTLRHYAGGCFKQKNNYWKKKLKCKKHGTKQIARRTLVHSMRAETSRQSAALSDISWERAHGRLEFFTSLSMTTEVMQALTLGL